MKRQLLTAAITVIFAAWICPPGLALTSLIFETQQAQIPLAGIQVVANGEVVLTVPGTDQTSQQKAQAIASRLQSALDSGVTPDQVTAQARGKVRVIRAESRILVWIDNDLAYAAQSTPQGLAQVWLAQIKSAFSLPHVRVFPSSALVPVNEKRFLAVAGNLTQPISVSNYDPSVVEVSVVLSNLPPGEPQAKKIALLGKSPGRTEVVIGSDEIQVTVPVRVAKYAGVILPYHEAAVTGKGVPKSLIERAGWLGARIALRPEPQAQVRLGKASSNRSSLSPGQETLVSVPVAMEGADYIPVNQVVQVRVKNEQVAPQDPTLLMLSNRPEKIVSRGLWYEGNMLPNQPIRLLYHHVNASPYTSDLVVELLNPSSSPARVQIIEGTAGPSRDEIFVGHSASSNFIPRRFQDIGYLITIPPNWRYTPLVHRLPSGTIASGIVEFRSLSLADLVLRVRMVPPGGYSLFSPFPSYCPEPKPAGWRFPSPQKTITASYTVGEHWTWIPIGKYAIPGTLEGEQLKGNYGVLYRIQIELSNPTRKTEEVELAFAAGVEPARAVLMLDGRVVETGMMVANAEQRITTYHLRPGQTRTISIETMPQAASSYPVSLILRPAR